MDGDTLKSAIKAKGWVQAADGSWNKPRTERIVYLDGQKAAVVTVNHGPKRIRQSSEPLLNKLETAFWNEYLKLRHPFARAQSIKFRLGNGISYKPDFVDLSAQKVQAWEVKGPHAFRGGFENLKVAAGLYYEVRWVLAWKQDGQWQQQEVLS